MTILAPFFPLGISIPVMSIQFFKVEKGTFNSSAAANVVQVVRVGMFNTNSGLLSLLVSAIETMVDFSVFAFVVKTGILS